MIQVSPQSGHGGRPSWGPAEHSRRSAPIWFWFSPINTASLAVSGQRHACHLAHMTGCPPGSGAEPHQPPLPPPHTHTPARKTPVAFVLLKPKGFENLPLRLKKWVPKNQLDKGCSPGPSQHVGHSGRFLATMSPRDSDMQLCLLVTAGT